MTFYNHLTFVFVEIEYVIDYSQGDDKVFHVDEIIYVVCFNILQI